MAVVTVRLKFKRSLQFLQALIYWYIIWAYGKFYMKQIEMFLSNIFSIMEYDLNRESAGRTHPIETKKV